MRALAPALLLLCAGCFESLVNFPKDVPDAGPPPDAGTQDAGTGDAGCTAAQLQEDVFNCGACGHACPTPVRALATCRAGTCGRGPCQPGFYDVDGPGTFGCESTCAGTSCALPDGGTVTLSVPAMHDLGTAGALSATGLATPQGATHRNASAVGESPGGSTTSTNSHYRHVGGFNGATP